MKKTYIFILLLFVVLSFASCNENDKSTITFYQSTEGSMPSRWEYEYIPDGYISLIKMDETLSSKIFSIVGGGTYFYRFKAEKPGEFTMCWVYYELDYWIMIHESYAVDYSINEKFEIQQIGDKYPIYEIEKYDKLLFEQFSGDSSLHLDWVLDDYPNIRYLITSDYETRTIDILVYGSDTNNESELRQKIENRLNEHNQDLNEVMHDTKINITFEDSDIENNDSE